MLRTFVLRALTAPRAALAFCLATAACSAPTTADLASEVPEVEEPLSLTVDDLDIRHGSLRIEASMQGGSADVSMWLGSTCAPHEVGRGIATRSGLAWSLSGEEVARAIECNLVVKAHGIAEDGTRVLKTAALDVSVSLVPDGAEVVRLMRQQSEGAETTLTFAAPTPARRLHLGGTVIGAEEESRGPRHMFISAFVVGNDDLARSMLHRRHVSVLGDHFLATVSVGPLTLDVSEPEEEAPVEVAPVEITPKSEDYEDEQEG